MVTHQVFLRSGDYLEYWGFDSSHLISCAVAQDVRFCFSMCFICMLRNVSSWGHAFWAE